jgi:hypothetical protein
VWNNDYQKPYAIVNEGASNKGISRKFDDSSLSVVSHNTDEAGKNGGVGLYPKDVSAGELAYYQIQLQEVIELNKRKDDDMKHK